ncbi:hypothetical protein D3C85_1092530 [compost metagenome]
MVGNDEQVRVGHNQSHEIGGDRNLSIGHDHEIRIGQDRWEQVGNDRYEATQVNHRSNVGGHREETVKGHHHLTVGQGMHHRTTVYQLQASERLVFQGPGGSITLDAEGIHLTGVTINLQGPVTTTASGSIQASTFQLSPELGQCCVEKSQ